ncbi:hypothetical protein SAMN05443245_1907 [Paraburkholderia fungorum]|uniref:Uncharacterized protein n=1 Tax=Paraburkholderia fungorum TaxID=134537 RepID=A0A1H1C1X3_9BURK|nr:hypothetical protein SAMN05443245_1907 [Paraburkholderia fungorum]
MLLRCSVKGRAVLTAAPVTGRRSPLGLGSAVAGRICEGRRQACRRRVIHSMPPCAGKARKTRILPCGASGSGKTGHSSGQCGEIGGLWGVMAADVGGGLSTEGSCEPKNSSAAKRLPGIVPAINDGTVKTAVAAPALTPLPSLLWTPVTYCSPVTTITAARHCAVVRYVHSKEPAGCTGPISCTTTKAPPAPFLFLSARD